MLLELALKMWLGSFCSLLTLVSKLTTFSFLSKSFLKLATLVVEAVVVFG